ncbi:uncharacterized protein VTP21DRAFT_1615 [Calcarisporiella thermophila]|uniref:uncharacterized protein n=1 Tax=Calcarisporiella thermophila TaxID=911321 RepID=UPI003744A3F2
MDILAFLPAEISIQILEKLSPTDVANARLVSRAWNALTRTPTLWRSIFYRFAITDGHLSLAEFEGFCARNSSLLTWEERCKRVYERGVNFQTGKCTFMHTIVMKDFVTICAFRLSGRYLATLSSGGRISVWELTMAAVCRGENAHTCVDYIVLQKTSPFMFQHLDIISTEKYSDTPYLIAVGGNEICLVLAKHGVVCYKFDGAFFNQTYLGMSEEYIVYCAGEAVNVWSMETGCLVWRLGNLRLSPGQISFFDSVLYIHSSYNTPPFSVRAVDVRTGEQLWSTTYRPSLGSNLIPHTQMCRDLVFAFTEEKIYQYQLSNHSIEKSDEYTYSGNLIEMINGWRYSAALLLLEEPTAKYNSWLTLLSRYGIHRIAPHPITFAIRNYPVPVLPLLADVDWARYAVFDSRTHSICIAEFWP